MPESTQLIRQQSWELILGKKFQNLPQYNFVHLHQNVLQFFLLWSLDFIVYQELNKNILKSDTVT